MFTDPSRSEVDDFRPLNDLHVRVEYLEMLRSNGLDSLEALFANSVGDDLGKPGLEPWRQRFRLELAVAGEERTFYLKRFRNPPRYASREVRRSGTKARSVAGLEAAWMRQLDADGVPCAKPVAMGEEFRSGRELRSAILTESVPGVSLERCCAEWNSADASVIRSLIVPLATLVGHLHACGYAHRDLYLSHVFYESGVPPERSLRLIDLQRVLRPKIRKLRWIIKDLASLNYSTPRGLVGNVDRWRWLTAYLRALKLDLPVRSLAYRVVGKTHRIARHDRRRRAGLENCGNDGATIEQEPSRDTK